MSGWQSAGDCGQRHIFTRVRFAERARQCEYATANQCLSNVHMPSKHTRFISCYNFAGCFRNGPGIHHFHRSHQSIPWRSTLGCAVLPHALHAGHRFAIWHIGGSGHLIGWHETIPKYVEGNDNHGNWTRTSPLQPHNQSLMQSKLNIKKKNACCILSGTLYVLQCYFDVLCSRCRQLHIPIDG